MMNDELKKKAYLEGMKLKKAGHDDEVIFARLEKDGIPQELARQVIKNLSIQKKTVEVATQKTNFDIAILRIGIGVFLAIVSWLLFPGRVYLPFGLIGGGIIYAMMAKSKMKK